MTELDADHPHRSVQQAVDASIDGMAVLDNTEEYRYVNQKHAELYGYEDPSELIGESWRSLYDDSTVERLESEVLPELHEAGEWRGRLEGKRRDGTTFPQELSLSLTPDETVICVVRDVSDPVDRLETLDRYETILENIHDAVYTLDAQGRITWVNDTAVNEFDAGYTREELIGSFVSIVLDEEDIEKSVDIIQDLISNEDRTSGRCEVNIKTAEGEPIPCELHLALLPFDDGEFQGTVGVARDLRDAKRREQRLSVLNRVLRHNLRNSVQAILGQSALLADGLEGKAEERVQRIRRESAELIDLSDKARLFSQAAEQDSGGQPVDAAEVVEASCSDFQGPATTATVTAQTPDECWVRAGEGLRVAVDNLIENAIEHNEAGVDVTVTVEPAQVDGDWVDIHVADNGTGIPNQEIEVIQAGEETPLQHGSGLGLWLVSWLVEGYGGRLTFDETAAEGGVVTIRLPAAAATT